jgi:hypothetical protein
MAQENELLSAVLEARQKVAEIDASLSEAKTEKESAEAKLIEYMDDSNLKSFKSSVLNCSCIRKETLYVSIDKERKDEAFKYIDEVLGRGDAIKPAIHNKTLSSLISELLKEGKSFPQDLFKYYFRPELTIIQAKKEG